jgi:hypothetical protein
MRTKTRKKRMRSTGEVRPFFYYYIQLTTRNIQMNSLLNLKARVTTKMASGDQPTTYGWTDATENSMIKTWHV